MINCQIKGSDGTSSDELDALSAVRSSAPFEPLPSWFKGDSIDVEFTFDLTNHRN